jgi:hypothetical protein
MLSEERRCDNENKKVELGEQYTKKIEFVFEIFLVSQTNTIAKIIFIFVGPYI